LASADLLEITGDSAVVGTPNVFVRDHVRAVYQERLADALAAELGRRVEVEVVIDRGLAV
jgi:hypothetical protein